MASTNITLQPIAKSVKTPDTGGSWSSWDYNFDKSGSDKVAGANGGRYVAYLFNLSSSGKTYDLIEASVQIYGPSSPPKIVASLIAGNSQSGTVVSRSDAITLNASTTKLYQIDFSNVTIPSNYVVLMIAPEALTSVYGAATVYMPSIQYPLPDLSITGISPSTVIEGDRVTVNFGGREDETLDVKFAVGGTEILSTTAYSDSTTELTQSWWVEEYGGGSDSMTVTVTASDSNGRSASKTFTIRKPRAIPISLSAPTSGTLYGDQQIVFSWTYGSGDGSISSASLHYSQDNVNWTHKSVSGSSYTAPVATFAAGTVYWYVDAISSYSVNSVSSTAHFNVKYNEASATPIAPKSGTLDGGQAIDFSWSITKGGGNVTGTQMEISTNDGASWTNKVDSTSQVTSFRATAGSLTAGKITWRVRAKDSLIGWGTWQQASFNVQYNKPTVSLTAPTSGTRNGGAAIPFNWSITAGSGNVTGTQMEYSTDDGVSWNTLVNDTTKSVINYTAAAGLFPGGTLKWRVRARDQYAGWSDYKNASFTVQYTVPTVTLTTPTSGTKEGGEKITFSWEITAGSSTVSATEMQYSKNDGVSWITLVSQNRQVLSYESSVAYFPPGKIIWRVRAKDTYAGWSAYKQANFNVSYSATSYIEQINSPTGGNINASKAQTFAGILRETGTPYTPFSIQSATFYWRSRETDAYNTVSMSVSGKNATVTIAGGTFPTGAVYWYIGATDNTGSTTSTPVYAVSTLASDIDAQPVAPVNTVEISNDDITFTWRFASTSGEPQDGAELQYSTDGVIWVQFAEAEGTVTSVIAPPDTFHAGPVYWRVRAFNRDGESGSWSAPAQFVAYGAPEAPSVTVDAVPFATVRWQGIGQASFEVEVDGKIYGPFLGTEKAYELYDYLDDGMHKARVRILGDAGLWSLWGETLFEIENVPESALTLRARTDVDTELTWVGGSSGYHVYRDRKLIARTNGHSFTDRAALGTHEYRVVERLANGNYNESALLTRTSDVRCMHIAALEDGDWIEIPHTLKSESDPAYSVSAFAEFEHQDNSEFPVVSVGPYTDESSRYSAVFLYTEQEEHRRFRALFRKPVILKTTDGVVMIGFLNAWERKPKTSRDKQYYTAYSFTLQRIDWEDFVDDTV